MRENPQYEGHGTVHMNAYGPHFYIRVEEGEKSPASADAITDMMNHRLGEMDERHGWEITHAHIEEGPAIAEVSWTPSEKAGHDCEYELEDFDVSLDWYSRSPIHEWDFL